MKEKRETDTSKRGKESVGAKKLNVSGIFLDMDGTIVDSREAYYEAARIAFQKMGQKTPEKETLLEIPRILERTEPIDNLIEGDTHKFMSAYLSAYYAITTHKTKLLPDIPATLEALSAKAKLALITMRAFPKENIMKELGGFGIAKYFTYVVTALDTEKPKPSPEALMKCGKALDVKMQKCVIVGDSISDVRAGKAAGSKTIAVLSGIFSRQELAEEKPDLIIEDLTVLPNFIG